MSSPDSHISSEVVNKPDLLETVTTHAIASVHWSHRDTAVENALRLLQLQALHHTHKEEATRLLMMAARLGFTDVQIADMLRKGLPKLNENDQFYFS